MVPSLLKKKKHRIATTYLYAISCASKTVLLHLIFMGFYATKNACYMLKLIVSTKQSPLISFSNLGL